MKGCSVDSLDTLYAVIAELNMPDEFFQYWTEKTADSNKPPISDCLIELLQQYRLRLPGFQLKGVRDNSFLQGLDLAESNFDQQAVWRFKVRGYVSRSRPKLNSL